MLKNDLILKAAKGEKVERIPVWVMRQAGRILPEYRALRAKVSGFKELVSTPELVCEVTLQPVHRLGVDAAIIFSDILVIPEALGLDYEMIEKKGPFFPKTIESKADVSQLSTNNVEERLQYVLEGIRMTKQELDNEIPLIGFAGAPWTIFCYMIEGQGSKTFSKAKKMIYTQPELAHQLLSMITEATIQYLQLQINAGADIVQIFDSWAAVLDADMYREFALKYIHQICDIIDDVPKIVFPKGVRNIYDKMKSDKIDVVGIDWTTSGDEVRQFLGNNVTIQGNLDPCVLYSEKDEIKRRTTTMLNTYGSSRYIANLGHGVYPDTPWENVAHFIEVVQNYQLKRV